MRGIVERDGKRIRRRGVDVRHGSRRATRWPRLTEKDQFNGMGRHGARASAWHARERGLTATRCCQAAVGLGCAERRMRHDHGARAPCANHNCRLGLARLADEIDLRDAKGSQKRVGSLGSVGCALVVRGVGATCTTPFPEKNLEGSVHTYAQTLERRRSRPRRLACRSWFLVIVNQLGGRDVGGRPSQPDRHCQPRRGPGQCGNCPTTQLI